MIIGLTGKNGGGKGEVAAFLVSCGYQYRSLSDEIRNEMKSLGISITRETMIEFANKVRAEKGPSVFAERVLAGLEPDKNYVIDSIRNPFEVEALRKREDFFLLNVEADPKIRFERLKRRNRESDPKSYDDFLKIEAAEASSNDPAAQQINRTIEMADAEVVNNGTIEELHDEMKEVLKALAINTKRPDWDTYFMSIAQVVALRSNCIKRKVAAVVVKDNRIISTGYNGTPRGIKNCYEGGCPRCHTFGPSGENLEECYCAHAEENSIAQAAYHGVCIKDATMYSTFSPCLGCAKLIINSGIKRVVYNAVYPMEDVAMNLLKEAGVVVERITLK